MSSLVNKVQGKIVNGNNAVPNQFPYQVSLRSISGSTASICGGSILSANFILTAAHCTKSYSKFEIGFGSVWLNTPMYRMTSYSKTEHPDFNPVLLSNVSFSFLQLCLSHPIDLQDISLIKLPSPIPFGDSISAIQLPKLSQASTSFLNKHGIVSGYGRISDDSTHVSQNLNYVDMRVISKTECSNIFGSKIVTNNVICARGAEKSNRNACLGGC